MTSGRGTGQSNGDGLSRGRQSLAATVGGWRQAIGPLLLLSAASLPVAWSVPLFTARLPFLWRQEVSVLGGLVELWRIDPPLFAIVLVLAVILPLLKALATAYVWYLVPARRAGNVLRRLRFLAKLAMTEVFLLAVLIVGLKGVGIGRIDIEWGLYAFAAVALLALATSQLADAAAAEPPAGTASAP